MPDIRTLLEDATLRAPHPDPVNAVHATVRRRAARRSVATAAAAVAVLVAGLASVATRVDTAPPVGPSPAPTTPVPTSAPATREPDPGAFAAYVELHPEAFLGLREENGTDVVLLMPGADRAYWTQQLDEASGGYRFRAQECPKPLAHYETIMAEATAFHWPSSAHIAQDPMMWPNARVCAVSIVLSSAKASAADRAAARAKWGTDVVVTGEMEPTKEGS